MVSTCKVEEVAKDMVPTAAVAKEAVDVEAEEEVKNLSQSRQQTVRRSLTSSTESD